MLAPFAKEHLVRPFELEGVNIFTGNELDPTDEPDAALIFGGDGTLHRHLGTLALKKIPTLAVPVGSANDFAATMGIHSVADALLTWKQFCNTRMNTVLVDLGTIQPLHPLRGRGDAAASGRRSSRAVARRVAGDHALRTGRSEARSSATGSAH